MACSLNNINNYQRKQSQFQSLSNLHSLRDPFQTIPEPEQSQMVEATLRRAAMQQHLERIAERIHSHGKPCSDCTERLVRAVMAADSVGGIYDLDKYRAMALHLMEMERWMLQMRLQQLKPSKSHHFRAFHQEDKEEYDDDEEEEEEGTLKILV